MSWMKKIREIREKNLAKKKEIKTGAVADAGSEDGQLPPHDPDKKSVNLSSSPEKDKRLNPIFLYGGGGLFFILICAVMFSSCFHDDNGDRRKPSPATVQGDVLNDQSVQQIEMKNLKQMNDDAQSNAKSGKKNTQGTKKPTKEENTVVEKRSTRSSAGSSSQTQKKKELSPAEQYSLDAETARYKRALDNEASAYSEEAQAKKSAIFFDLGDGDVKKPSSKPTGRRESPANEYYNDVLPEGGDSDYIQVMGR